MSRGAEACHHDRAIGAQLTASQVTNRANRTACQAKAWSTTNGNGDMPRGYPTPVIDLMRRFPGMAWYWLGAYGIFRTACLRAFESASSIGVNS